MVLINLLKNFSVDYVDTITEPGVERIVFGNDLR